MRTARMMTALAFSMGSLAVASLAVPTLAADGPAAPNVILPLLQCRTITADTDRLACFDKQTAALGQANDQRGLVIMDRGDIQNARRSIFGLSLPTLSFLDHDAKGKTEEITEIDAKIVAAKAGPYGKWTVVLDDGGTWVQTEPKEFARDPKAGMPIVIRKAAMGSFLAKIDGQIAVRIARVR